MASPLFRTKSVEQSIADTDAGISSAVPSSTFWR